ncbi:pyridoxal-dependent decarboxylase [Scytonema sp. NUACC21]
MTTPRDVQTQAFSKASRGISDLFQLGEIPDLDTPGSRAVEAWFLGPKAENVDVLESLIVEAIRDQAYWRRNYHPSDPSHITEEIKRSQEYLQTIDSLKESYNILLAFLKKSVPFFSTRYQGHMNWDLTIPSIVGYFAAMLYNPNNVAFEGSTATTLLEQIVGDDLCRMLGYTVPTPEQIQDGAIPPWGHITCGGTIANIEALWSARNLKFYPIALKEALEKDPRLTSARDIKVRAFDSNALAWTEQTLRELSTWQLLNLQMDDVLSLPGIIQEKYGVSSNDVTEALSSYSLQDLGMQEFAKRYLDGIPSPVFFVPGTKHYSFPKAAALLGMGASNMIDIMVDEFARMRIHPPVEKPETTIRGYSLREEIQRCLDEKIPVYTVVAVIGSTEESAVDPLAEVLALREEFRNQGLEFTIHADAAWGGYHASLLREDEYELPEPSGLQSSSVPVSPLSDYVKLQFENLGRADSITVDPHKSGYIPYPSGALCYRNGAMRDLVTFQAPYILHEATEPTVGIYGIEGSKPGAAPAAVFLSHRVIRPTKNGYGKIIGQSMYSCDKLHARLLSMVKSNDPFIVVPLPPVPDLVPGSNEEEKIQYIRDNIDGKTNEAIVQDAQAMEILKEMGPDQNILVYAFNFKTAENQVNNNLELANILNKEIYDRLSINQGEDIYSYNLIVSTTDFKVEAYGSDFIEYYKKRLGVSGSAGDSITVIRSVIMDPWVTETPKGSFLDILEVEFRKTIESILHDLKDRLGVWL